MPVEWRLHVLEERLRREVGERFRIEPVDLYGLTPMTRSVTIASAMRGALERRSEESDGSNISNSSGERFT